jgi:hypothetical protein
MALCALERKGCSTFKKVPIYAFITKDVWNNMMSLD